MILISGVLKGPYGDARAGVTIVMRSVKTSATVLNLARSQSTTDDSGRYSLNVEPGAYEVIISINGAQPERVGTIEVYTDSLPGTLNDYLRRPGESDLTPGIIQTVDRMRAEAAASAAAAKVSEQNAENNVKLLTDAGFGNGPRHRTDVYAQGNVSFLQRFNGTSANAPAAVLGGVLSMPMDGGPTCGYIAVSSSRAAWIGASNFTGKTVSWVSLWSSGNTTVDANGFIKKASPIARLSGAPEKMADDYLDGFTLAGSVAVNSEADGVTAERVSVGVYRVIGSLGFADEGWNIEVPQDTNGNRLCFVETSTAKGGTITVKVSKRRFDVDTAAIVAGDPMDIPDSRWIDLRLEMPVREAVEKPIPDEQEKPTDDLPGEGTEP